MQKAGKFVHTQEWYAEMQVIINRVKDPGYELGKTDNVSRFLQGSPATLGDFQEAPPPARLQSSTGFPGQRAVKPVRKGPVEITGFQSGAESTVSKTVGGKQVEGIKTKDGREIFVGDEFILAGKVWRYDGNGKATQLRNARVRKR